MKIDYKTKKQVDLDELDKVDQLIYESQFKRIKSIPDMNNDEIHKMLIDNVSNYTADYKGIKSKHLHYNKILGEDSVNISFKTLKKIIDRYWTSDTDSTIIFLILHVILDPIFIKTYKEEEITKLLEWAIYDFTEELTHYDEVKLEKNPLLQLLKEKNLKYFNYANDFISFCHNSKSEEKQK